MLAEEEDFSYFKLGRVNHRTFLERTLLEFDLVNKEPSLALV
jgi:hypothetical protein